MKRTWVTGSIGAAAALLLAACSGGYAGNYGGGFGATPGGAQDMRFARELVAQGQVPPPEAFFVEGMFSEHDLPLEGGECLSRLCLNAVMGIAPDREGTQNAWVQVGLSSDIDPETFQRPSVSVIATVDVSGSMDWDYAGGGVPREIANALLHAIASQLGESDRIAIVTYGSEVKVWLPLTNGADQTTVHAVIDEIHEGGSTNMEAGLKKAYQVAAEAIGQTDEVRLMLFTDIQPNVGASTPTEFDQLVAAGSAEGVGITVFGLGLGAGTEFLTGMSKHRGGNGYTLPELADVETVMAESWPWMVSPIAYDLSVLARPKPGLEVAEAFGFPGDPDPLEASLEVATVFLSKKRGALLLRLAPTGETLPAATKVDVELAYTGTDGTPYAQTLLASYDGQPFDEHGRYMPQPGIAKAVSLASLVSAMKDGATSYGSDPAAAVALYEPARDRFAAESATLSDPALDPEVTFATDLLDLMKAGAPQGSLYGY